MTCKAEGCGKPVYLVPLIGQVEKDGKQKMFAYAYCVEHVREILNGKAP